MAQLDRIDRLLLRELQADASRPYSELSRKVGLSGAATHERVRKLRERGVIGTTTVLVDAAAIEREVLAYVLIEATAWMGESETRAALLELDSVQEAHIVAGRATLLLKLRAGSTAELQRALRDLHGLPGASRTESIVVLETLFERAIHVPEG